MPDESVSEDLVNVPAGARWPDIVGWCLFGMVILFFLMLKAFSFHWEVGDENVYFYMAWATVDHGAVPYGDYFFAHPPLHLVPGFVVFGLLGFGPVTVRLIPVGATLAGAVFLFLLARRHMGTIGAVATAFLYLTAFSLIRASTHWTGINLSVMWVIIGLWALWNQRHVTAGVCMAMGVCTGNYVLPGAIMAGMLAFLQSRRSGLRFLAGFAIPWGLAQILGWIAGGKSYFQGVYQYHVMKPQAQGASWKMSVRVFTDNFSLFLGALLGPLLASLDNWLGRHSGAATKRAESEAEEPEGAFMKFWTWWRCRLTEGGPAGLARVGAMWALGYILFIALLPRVFPFYFLLLFPGMALAGGYAVDRVARHAWALAKRGKSRSKGWWEAAAVLGVLLLAVMVGHLVRIPVQRTLLPKYVRTHDKPMKWTDGYLPGFINRALRTCCWDDVAVAYKDYGTVQEILYHESRFFEKANELAEYVKSHSRADQTIFGDSSTAGLVAILAGRRLAGDFADTNTMRFRSGVTPVKEAIERIDTPELAFVLVGGSLRRGRDGREVARFGKFASIPEFRNWLNQNFRIAHRVADRTKGWFFLLERKPSGSS